MGPKGQCFGATNSFSTILQGTVSVPFFSEWIQCQNVASIDKLYTIYYLQIRLVFIVMHTLSAAFGLGTVNVKGMSLKLTLI